MVNLKNPDLDLTRSILLEYGFWISPQKRKIRFGFKNPFSGFPKKTHP